MLPPALKLVGEAFPFREGGCYVLGADSHNSVNGIRRFATQAGANVHYLRSQSHGGLDVQETHVSVSSWFLVLAFLTLDYRSPC